MSRACENCTKFRVVHRKTHRGQYPKEQSQEIVYGIRDCSAGTKDRKTVYTDRFTKLHKPRPIEYEIAGGKSCVVPEEFVEKT